VISLVSWPTSVAGSPGAATEGYLASGKNSPTVLRATSDDLYPVAVRADLRENRGDEVLVGPIEGGGGFEPGRDGVQAVLIPGGLTEHRGDRGGRP
jgi:hypothetical protein